MFFCIPKPNLQPGVSLMQYWDWMRLESHRQKNTFQKSETLNKFKSDRWLYLSNKIWIINCCHILKRSPQQWLNCHYLLKSAVGLAWSQNHEHICGVVLPPTGKKTIFIFQAFLCIFEGKNEEKLKSQAKRKAIVRFKVRMEDFCSTTPRTVWQVSVHTFHWHPHENYSLEMTRLILGYGFQILIVTVEEKVITCWSADTRCPSGSGWGAASWRNLALGWVTKIPSIGSFSHVLLDHTEVFRLLAAKCQNAFFICY